MTDGQRIVIIGAGHNGLVCAALLAQAGREVSVFEAAEYVGGAAVTREFEPGFRVSPGAHLLYGLDPEVSKRLSLENHGLELAHTQMSTVGLDMDGKYLALAGDSAGGRGVSVGDQKALKEFNRRMNAFATLLNRINKSRPPRIAGGGAQDALGAAQIALGIRRLGQDDMREFLRIAAINIYDVLEERFESDLLKGMLAVDGVLGTHLGPRSNNSVLVYLQRLSGQGPTGLAIPAGGMGAVTSAMAASARTAGAEVRTGTPVARILMKGDRVTGIELADGETIEAGLIISNADPRTTLFELLGARYLEAGFAKRIGSLRMQGNAAKLHLALEGLPEFPRLRRDRLADRLVIAPDLGYVERAFDHAKYGEYSPAPVMEITIPSYHDNSLAPAGNHVLSAVVQYAPRNLKGGWRDARDAFKEIAIDLLDSYAPGLRKQVRGSELLTPEDLEGEFRMQGGHWHHVEYALDQFLMMRPVAGTAQYRTPVPGLYLCGAGAHPGGHVSGLAGSNAAAAILAAGEAA